MSGTAARILLNGQDSLDGLSVREALADGRGGQFTVERVPRLAQGLDRLRENGVSAVLLDLNLPDSQEIATFEQHSRAAPHVPILVTGRPPLQAQKRKSGLFVRLAFSAFARSSSACFR